MPAPATVAELLADPTLGPQARELMRAQLAVLYAVWLAREAAAKGEAA